MIDLLKKTMPILLNEEEKGKVLDRTEGFTFSDMKAVAREAAMCALRDNIEADKIEYNHFASAFVRFVPKTVSEKLKTIYKNFDSKLTE